MEKLERTKRLFSWLTPGSISPRLFWTFQAIFWSAVFTWRTAHTLAYGYGWTGADLRLMSITLAIAVTLIMAKVVSAALPSAPRFGWFAFVMFVTMIIALVHTGVDRTLYAAARNGWNFQPVDREEYFQILSVNAWVFLSWAGFFIVILQFSRLRERERAIQELTQLAKDAKLQTLIQQLNPHFLFNTLNSLGALITEKRTQDADRMLVQLGRFLRHVIDADHETETDLGSEIDMARDYLAIQKVRFEDRLEFEIDVPANCQSALVPVLLLQPVIENAVKHGQDEETAICRVMITARQQRGQLILTVTDKGPGFENLQDIDSGAGLSLIRERLKTHYGASAQLMLSNAQNAGAVIVISMPFHTEKSADLERMA